MVEHDRAIGASGHGRGWQDVSQACLQVAYSRVESSLELPNARVRVESRVAGLDAKSSRKSSQYYLDAQDALELQLLAAYIHRSEKLINCSLPFVKTRKIYICI